MAHLRQIGGGGQLQYYLNGRKRIKHFPKGVPKAVVEAERKRVNQAPPRREDESCSLGARRRRKASQQQAGRACVVFGRRVLMKRNAAREHELHHEQNFSKLATHERSFEVRRLGA